MHSGPQKDNGKSPAFSCGCTPSCSPGAASGMICSKYQKQYIASNDGHITDDKQVTMLAYFNSNMNLKGQLKAYDTLGEKALESQAENKKLVFLLGGSGREGSVKLEEISETLYHALRILLSNYKALQDTLGAPMPMQTFAFNIGNVNNHSFVFVCNTNGESAILNGLGLYNPEHQAVLAGFNRAFHEVFETNKFPPPQIISPDQDRKYRQKENTCRVTSAMMLASIDPDKPLKEQKLAEKFAAIQAKEESQLRGEFVAACNQPNRPAVQDEPAPKPAVVASAPKPAAVASAPVALRVDQPTPVSLELLDKMFKGKLARHQCSVASAGTGFVVQQARYREVNHDNVYGKHNLCVVENNQLRACQPNPDVIELFMMFKMANELWPGKTIHIENCHSREALNTMQIAKTMFVNYMKNSPDVVVKKDMSGFIKLPEVVSEAAMDHAAPKTTLKVK